MFPWFCLPQVEGLIAAQKALWDLASILPDLSTILVPGHLGLLAALGHWPHSRWWPFHVSVHPALPSDNHKMNSSSLSGLCSDVTFLLMSFLILDFSHPSYPLCALLTLTAQQRRWQDASSRAPAEAEQHHRFPLQRQVCLWLESPGTFSVVGRILSEGPA